jgi:osmotically-inducible protein OsmY
MKVTGRMLPFTLTLILPLVFACHTSKPDLTVPVPAVETAQDEALSESVRQRLLGDKKADLSGVKVVSNSGTIYLTGTVKSLDARTQAVKLAWEVRGVQRVVNTLEVEK